MARLLIVLTLCGWGFVLFGQPKDGMVAQYLFNDGRILNTASVPSPISPDPIIRFNAHPSTDRYEKQMAAVQVTSGFINVGQDPITAESSVTVSVWAKAYDDIDTTVPGIDLARDQYIYCSGGRGSEAGTYILWNNGKVSMGRKTAYGEAQGYYQAEVESDRWYMLTMIYDRSAGYMFMYVNRGLVIYSPITPGSYVDDYEQLLLGMANGWQGNHFHGEIDDVHVYNRALNYTELSQLYTANVHSNEPATTGLESTAAVKFNVYPNPATDQITVEVPANFEYDGLSVSDLTGRTLIYTQRKVNSPAAHYIELPALLVNGLYLVQLHKESKVVGSSRLLIKR